jgi:hypothetical protein
MHATIRAAGLAGREKGVHAGSKDADRWGEGDFGQGLSPRLWQRTCIDPCSGIFELCFSKMAKIAQL